MLCVICKMHYVPNPRIHHHSLHSTKHVNFVLLRRASRISWIHMCRHSAHAQYPHSKGRCYAWEGTNTNQINTIKLRKLHWYYVQSCWPTIVYHQHSTLFWVFITTHDLFIYDCHTVSWTKSLTFFFSQNLIHLTQSNLHGWYRGKPTAHTWKCSLKKRFNMCSATTIQDGNSNISL